MDENCTQVAIIGAGLAGLMAAVTAAREGAEVVVFDARKSIGGRARTHERSGFLLNEGGHALYEGGAALLALDALGIDPPSGSPDPKRYVGLTTDGTMAPFPMGPATILRSRLLSGRGRLQFARLLGGLGRLDPGSVVDRSARDFLAESLPDPGARAVVESVARTATYQGDLDRVSADAAVLQLQHAALGGVRYVHGGWGTIVGSLRRLAVAAGAEIRSSSPVRRVSSRRDEAGGFTVEVGPAETHADTVVMACGSPRLASDLAFGLSPTLEAAAAAATPVTAATLDVGFADGWTPGWVMGVGVPVFVTTHAPTADLAPAGQSLASMFRYHDASPPDAVADRAQMENVLDRLRPDWRAAASEVSFGARQVVAFDRPRPETGGMAGRPVPELADRPGLFVAGDWVGPEGLLADASVASGRTAGRLAARSSARPAVRTAAGGSRHVLGVPQ